MCENPATDIKILSLHPERMIVNYAEFSNSLGYKRFSICSTPEIQKSQIARTMAVLNTAFV
jgi:hypothetical protein